MEHCLCFFCVSFATDLCASVLFTVLSCTSNGRCFRCNFRLKDDRRRLTAELEVCQTALTAAREEAARLQTTLDSTLAENRQLLDNVTQRANQLEGLLKTEQAKVDRLERRPTENEEKERVKKTDALKVCVGHVVSLLSNYFCVAGTRDFYPPLFSLSCCCISDLSAENKSILVNLQLTLKGKQLKL